MTSGELLHSGQAQHTCEPPRLNLELQHGAVWRCDCGRRWQLRVEIIGLRARRGEWGRYRLPWVRR